jgi:hypothetical protein
LAEVRVPIRAEEAVPDQNLRVVFEFPEASGFDADPVIVGFETRAFAPPKLVLADLGIDDASGNGRVEPGEVVEVTCRIQNAGNGDAADVTARVENSENVFLTVGSRSEHHLGTLLPGEHKDLAFSFYTSKRLREGESLPLAVELQEGRGRFTAREPLAITLNAHPRRPQEIVVERATWTGARGGGPAGELSVDVEREIPEGRARNPDATAVVIGVRNYRSRAVPPVEFAHRDVAVVKAYLVRTLGFDPKNVIEVPDATLSDFRRVFGIEGKPQGQLMNWVRAGRSDVFVYYAGHGAPDPGSHGAYFVPSDADPNYIASGGYSLDLFWENLGKLPARNLTVVLDTCFSGNSEEGLVLADVSPALLQVRAEFRGPEGSVVMTSAGPDQVSTWYREKKHSLFTYWWLKGLGGAADADVNREVTVGEMAAYLGNEVPYWARRLSGQEQTPVIMGEPTRVLVWLR